MREPSRADKNGGRREGRALKLRAKQDTVLAQLTAPELHAYYIALICSKKVIATSEGLILTRDM